MEEMKVALMESHTLQVRQVLHYPKLDKERYSGGM